MSKHKAGVFTSSLFGLIFLLSLTTSAQQPKTAAPKKPFFDGASWWRHVSVLADDKMEGRATGSPGLERASQYIVDQLRRDGLQPAGTKGFFQPISFRTRELDESQSSIALVQNGKSRPVALGDEAIFSTRFDLAPEINAPLVFVGYGNRIPEIGLDDFAGLDVKGKILVTLSGKAEGIPGPLSSHYASSAERAKLLRELGALGSIGIPNPDAMDLPWSRIVSGRKIPSMAIDDEALNDSKGVQMAVIWNPEKAEALFEGSGHTFAEILELARAKKPLPKFEMNKALQARTKLIQTKVTSSNVVAKLPGTDPKLKDEYIVLSAHMDHLGVGPAIDGDKIYNGAMDNASGTASLLEVAKSLKGVKLKRSLIFLFVTAEEKGLLGSRYFAANPTVPIKSIVANINTDMFLPIFPMKSIIVYGLGESSLGDIITEVAKREGVTAMDDPEPQLNHFIRSDQYNFIKRGVPALALKNGFEKGSPEEAKVKEWQKARYHAPSDDLKQPVDLSAAVEFNTIVRGTLIEAANAPHRPEWKATSFFRRYAEEANSHSGQH